MKARWLWIVRDVQVTGWCDRGDGWFPFPRSALIVGKSKRWEDLATGTLVLSELLEAFGCQERMARTSVDDARTVEELWSVAERLRCVSPPAAIRSWQRTETTDRIMAGVA